MRPVCAENPKGLAQGSNLGHNPVSVGDECQTVSSMIVPYFLQLTLIFWKGGKNLSTNG